MSNRSYNSYRSSNESLAKTAGIYGAIFVGLGALAFGCGKAVQEPDSKVERIVENAGYINPEVTDVDILFVQLQGCGEDDLVGYDVSATSATTGNEVNLRVCDGIFKGMTIRAND